MAQVAGFEERFTVVGLLLAYLDQSFRTYTHIDGRISTLYEALKLFKCFLENQQDIQALTAFTEIERRELETVKMAEKITVDQASEQEWALERLESYSFSLKENHILEKTEGMACVREWFHQDLEERQVIITKISAELEHTFRFVQDSFGEEQEMVLFVTGLSKNEKAMEFISSHGCDTYFKYSEILLYREKEDELRSACLEMTGGSDPHHGS